MKEAEQKQELSSHVALLPVQHYVSKTMSMYFLGQSTSSFSSFHGFQSEYSDIDVLLLTWKVN